VGPLYFLQDTARKKGERQKEELNIMKDEGEKRGAKSKALDRGNNKRRGRQSINHVEMRTNIRGLRFVGFVIFLSFYSGNPKRIQDRPKIKTILPQRGVRRLFGCAPPPEVDRVNG